MPGDVEREEVDRELADAAQELAESEELVRIAKRKSAASLASLALLKRLEGLLEAQVRTPAAYMALADEATAFARDYPEEPRLRNLALASRLYVRAWNTRRGPERSALLARSWDLITESKGMTTNG